VGFLFTGFFAWFLPIWQREPVRSHLYRLGRCLNERRLGGTYFFLVDRISLRDQTLGEFKMHHPNEPRWPKEDEYEISTDRGIYVSTYPTMLNIIRNHQNSLSPHFFDLIVVEESHRSIYNTYQETLDYFNTITLGLIATPTDAIDHNTFKLFECEDFIEKLVA